MKKFLLTLVTAIFCLSASWADNTTWTCSNLGSATISDITGSVYSSGEIKFKAAKGSNTTNPSYNKAGDVRLYAGNTLEVYSNTPNLIINSLSFKISTQGKKRLTEITASSGTIATQAEGDTEVNWTGNSASITFTVGEKAIYGSDASTSAGQLCFDSVVVEYTIVSSDATKVTLSFPEKEYKVALGETFTAPALTVDPTDAASAVVYSISDNDFATINATTGAVTLLEGKTGKATVTASIPTDNADYFCDPASYILNVVKPVGDSGDAILNFTEQGYTNQEVVNELYVAPVTVYFNLEGQPNSNKSQYYISGTAIRVYGGNGFKLVADDGYVMKSATINYGSAKNSLSASTGNYSLSNKTGTWTASNNKTSEVTFTFSGTSGNDQIQSIEVEYAKYVVLPEISSIQADENGNFSDPDGIQVDLAVEAGYSILYTTDGKNPRIDASGNKTGKDLSTTVVDGVAKGSIYINAATTTVKALAYIKDGYKSSVVSKTFTFVENNAKISGYEVVEGDAGTTIMEMESMPGFYGIYGNVDSDPFTVKAIAEEGYEVWYYNCFEQGTGEAKMKISATGAYDTMPMVLAENNEMKLRPNRNYPVYVFTKKNGLLSEPTVLFNNTKLVEKTLEAPTFTFGESEVEHGATLSHSESTITLHFDLAEGHELYHAHKPIVKENVEENPSQKPARVAEATVEKNGLTFTNVTEQLDEDGNLTLDAKNGEYHFFVRNGNVDSDVKMFNLDTTVGIEAIDAETGAAVIYDMMGRRVKVENALKGIFIINGKKVIL